MRRIRKDNEQSEACLQLWIKTAFLQGVDKKNEFKNKFADSAATYPPWNNDGYNAFSKANLDIDAANPIYAMTSRYKDIFMAPLLYIKETVKEHALMYTNIQDGGSARVEHISYDTLSMSQLHKHAERWGLRTIAVSRRDLIAALREYKMQFKISELFSSPNL